MHECIQTSPGLQTDRFEAIARILAHELGSGPSDGMEDAFDALLAERREKEAALLIVPADWDISLGSDPGGRWAAAIRAPCQDTPASALADSEGAAILAALIAVILAGPSDGVTETSLPEGVSGSSSVLPFQQRSAGESNPPD